jgi:hypothetical protein
LSRKPSARVLVSDLAADTIKIQALIIAQAAGRIGPPGLPGFGAFHEDFIAAPGQTNFVLASTPVDPTLVIVVVDHLPFYPTLDFTIIDNVITWFGEPTTFDFVGGEDVRVYF